MKNSKIFDMVKKSRQAFCFNINTEQWLSDGGAAFSLAGLPKFSQETLLCMLDKADTDSFLITMNAEVAFNLYDDEEYEAELSSLILKWKKKEYIFIKFGINQGFFVNFKYIKEFLDSYDYIFKVKDTGKLRYLAVYDGMIPCAVIMPANIIDTGLLNRIGEVFDVVNIRMKKEAVRTGMGEVVPERNILGGWSSVLANGSEQVEIE